MNAATAAGLTATAIPKLARPEESLLMRNQRSLAVSDQV